MLGLTAVLSFYEMSSFAAFTLPEKITVDFSSRSSDKLHSTVNNNAELQTDGSPVLLKICVGY